MLVSQKHSRTSSRKLYAPILLFAVLVLPLGLAYAKDDTTGSDTYFEEAWDKIKAEVRAGTMSAEDAAAKILAIKKQKYAPKDETDTYLWQVWIKLQAEVQAGNMTIEEAEAKMVAIKKAKLGAKRGCKDDRSDGIIDYFNRLGISVKTLGRIKTALFEQGVDGEQMEPAFWGILKVIYEMREEGGEFEMDPRLLEYLQGEAGLNAEQVELVQSFARLLLRHATNQCIRHQL